MCQLTQGDPLSENDLYYPATWCARLDADTLTLRKATVDPGRLPDAGVDKLYLPDALVPYGSGFLMSGQTLTGVGGIYGVGGLWISEDGCDWTKDKVRDHGFDKVDSVSDYLCCLRESGVSGGGVTVSCRVRSRR
jgi:hypothetical protein